MKKVKAKDILKPGEEIKVRILPPDFWKKHKAEEQARKEKELKDEQIRIEALKCPACGSFNKNHVEKRAGIDIIGFGSRSWVTESYYYCMVCGVMFKDINKPTGTANGPTIRA